MIYHTVYTTPDYFIRIFVIQVWIHQKQLRMCRKGDLFLHENSALKTFARNSKMQTDHGVFSLTQKLIYTKRKILFLKHTGNRGNETIFLSCSEAPYRRKPFSCEKLFPNHIPVLSTTFIFQSKFLTIFNRHKKVLSDFITCLHLVLTLHQRSPLVSRHHHSCIMKRKKKRQKHLLQHDYVMSKIKL